MPRSTGSAPSRHCTISTAPSLPSGSSKPPDIRLSAPRDAPVRTCWRALTEPLRSPVAATWPDAYLRCFSGKPTVTRARSVALMGVEGRRRTARSTAAGLLGLSLVAIANAQPVPQGSPIPRVAPSAPVPTAPPELPAPLAPPTALPALNAVVTAVEIDGVTAYPEARLRALASGLVGDHTPLREIESVRMRFCCCTGMTATRSSWSRRGWTARAGSASPFRKVTLRT